MSISVVVYVLYFVEIFFYSQIKIKGKSNVFVLDENRNATGHNLINRMIQL